MAMTSKPAKTFNGYLKGFPKSTQSLLKKMRATIKRAAPGAGEKISYGMPAFTLSGNLVYFAGYEHHIGFYPGAAAVVAFKKDIKKYKWAKGSIQFPIDQPLPLGLVTRIVKYCVKQRMIKRARSKR